MKQITKPTHGSLEWLQTRHKHDGATIVGASEISVIMGCNDYKNIIDLAIEKMQPPIVREANASMKRGTWLEPSLITAAQEELNLQVETPEVMYLNGRIIATLDGLADDGRLIECKTTTKWVANDPCLSEWYWQAQAQMHCTGATLVTFVVLDRQLTISMFDVQRHENDIAGMVERNRWVCRCHVAARRRRARRIHRRADDARLSQITRRPQTHQDAHPRCRAWDQPRHRRFRRFLG